MKLRFTRSEADLNLYFKVEDDKALILVLYVDNLFLTGTDPLIHKFNTLSQYMVEPHHSHWIGAKNFLRYLQGTITHGLRYTARGVRLHGYSNVDWAGSVVDHKSTSGCCFSLGFASISWMSGKQKSVALSTAKAEYITAKNHVFHDRSKHIDIRYHFIRDMVQRGAIRLHHIGTDEQVANILTKPLGKVKFLTFQERLGVMERPSYEGHI
eukprot:PITA_21741